MSTPSRPQPQNSVKIALDPAEARVWRGRGIVVDLFRFSNTITARRESGRRDARVYPSPAMALSARRTLPGSDLFSEIALGVEQYDNSPYTALYGSDPARPALSVTNSGSPAAPPPPLAPEGPGGRFAHFSAP